MAHSRRYSLRPLLIVVSHTKNADATAEESAGAVTDTKANNADNTKGSSGYAYHAKANLDTYAEVTDDVYAISVVKATVKVNGTPLIQDRSIENTWP